MSITGISSRRVSSWTFDASVSSVGLISNRPIRQRLPCFCESGRQINQLLANHGADGVPSLILPRLCANGEG
jgi:hypothetical protein